jgi:hypothetical protein
MPTSGLLRFARNDGLRGRLSGPCPALLMSWSVAGPLNSGLRDPEVSAFGLPQAGAYDPGLGFAPHLVLIPDRRQLRQERFVPLLIPA